MNLENCEDILSNKSMEESKVDYIITSKNDINGVSPLKYYKSEGKLNKDQFNQFLV